ncbi:hypothetical protein UZ36_00510 [Candidatus Nitromaritima sp. SCGC AAA799-C22]|nr:hypothetical protein UZ36_00510 [Candidatus Nitromaritima sp. SCGC AAA799-C22]
MRDKPFYSYVFSALILLGLTFSQVTVEPANAEDTSIINPGAVQRCSTDFIVENIDNETADLKVVLGHKVFISEMVNPGERLAYSLPGTIVTAKLSGGENLTMDDVAVIINLGPKANLSVRCLKLRNVPLREKDPLTVFK